MASGWFDAEGVAAYARDVVDGVLTGYFLSTIRRASSGCPRRATRAGAWLVLRPGPEDFAALVRRLVRGLVVTEPWGRA